MYNVIIYLIQVGVAIASLFSDKVRKMWRGEQESFRILREKINPADRYIWFHAASLGEFEQGRPLMEEVRRQHPEAMRCARTTREPTSSAICPSTP